MYYCDVVVKHPCAAVVLAAGKGSRMGAEGNKAYLTIAGRAMVAWSLAAVLAVPEVTRTLLVTRGVDLDLAREVIEHEVAGDVEVIEGGASRHESELLALRHLAPDIEAGRIDVVLLHDGARPLADAAMMREAVDVARRYGGAVPGFGGGDIVEVGPDGAVRAAGPGLVRVQTPQAFRAPELLAAYGAAEREGFEGTDTSSSVERFSDLAVRVFPGRESNIKVTYAPDQALAERLLGRCVSKAERSTAT